MTIQEIPITGFNHKLENSTLNYPQSTNENAPRFFFNMLSIASRGGSKTYTIVKLIKDYEEHKLIDNDKVVHPIRTFLISPTYEANPIFNNLKSLSQDDIYNTYSDEILQGIMDDVELVKEEIKAFQEYENAYKILDKCPKEKVVKLLKSRPELFDILEVHNYQHPDQIPQPRFTVAPVNIIILDDLMGSDCFNKKSKSLLTYFLIKNRHFMVSFCMLVQNLKSVPKPIRSNCNLYFLGKFASKKVILNDLYEEVSNVLTEDQFDELYTHATSEKYGSLVIDNTSGIKKFYKGFDKELIFTEN
jgi:hypothetical protein